MLLDGLITLLGNDAGVSAQVAARIYKSVLPRGYTLPALALHRYAGSQDYEYDGPTATSENQIQIDIYGDTSADCQLTAQAVRNLLAPYTGTLPDGTIVQACYLERDMDMPFLPHADSKGLAFRAVLGFRIIGIGF